MNLLFGYTVLEKIGETRRSVIYRVKKEGKGKTCIIKVLNADRPSPADLARFRQEYDKIKKLDLQGIISTQDIIEHPTGFALVLEDFGGVPLSEFIKNDDIDCERFLAIACSLSDTLGSIHTKGIIHRDIKPQNILINPESGEVKITDFGIATEFTRERDLIDDKEKLAGTLVYMSPEQTGRMNRSVDTRSDIYSLGVTFYEMLTGIVPFTSKDPIEIIHSHIARTPVPPRELNLSVPRTVSDIVMKLLAKTPEERYQSCAGLAADLTRCRDQLKEKGHIDNFTPGMTDYPDTLPFPSTLYGREKEIDSIIAEWKRVRSGGKSLVLLEGSPGSGKTAMMKEAMRLLSADRGFILSAGLNEESRDIPYGHIISAFTGLVRQLLTEPGEKLELWKSRIDLALGSHGKVVTDVIPELERIIGKQKDDVILNLEESFNRFSFIFKQMLSIFCSANHPVALFLDDMHLADASTINILQAVLIDPVIDNLMIIASIRDDRVDRSHRLRIMEKIVVDYGIPVTVLPLPSFSKEHVGKILELIVMRSGDDVDILAAEIHRKTGGNAYAVYQFLRAIYEDGLFTISAGKGWSWNIGAIRRLTVTENVVELMIKKISLLPDPTQDVLSTASCIGIRFDFATLARISGLEPSALLDTLEPALRLEVIEFNEGRYEFMHNRLHETVYSLIPDGEKIRLHTEIGRHLEKNSVDEESDERIFEIVNQMNRGMSYLSTEQERIHLAELNRKASARSYNSGSYDMALGYAVAGISLLGKDRWTGRYDLTNTLFRLRAECEYRNANYKNADSCFDELILHCKTPGEKAKVHLDRSHLFMSIGNHGRAVAEAMKGLRCIGAGLPEKPSSSRIVFEMIKTRILRSWRSIEGLMGLPSMKDRDSMLIMSLLGELALGSYFVNPNLMFLAVTRMVSISLRRGNSAYSAFAYCWYGLLHIVALGKYRTGRRLGDIAIALNDRYYNPNIHYITSVTFGVLLNHWSRHVSTGMEYFEKNYATAQETGDLSFAGHIACWITWTCFVRGEKLEELQGRINGYLSVIDQFRSGSEYVLYPVLGYIMNMQGRTKSPGDFSHGTFNESIFEKITNRPLLYAFYLFKCHYHLIFGNAVDAEKMAVMMKKYIAGAMGLSTYPAYFFYSAIASTQLGTAVGKRRAKSCLKKLSRFSSVCASNYMHMELLVSAEIARLSKKTVEASDLYDRAIQAARDGGFIHDEAMACELAGRFFTGEGKRNFARAYMFDARNAYLRWGAAAKVADIDNHYPEIRLGYDRAASKKIGGAKGDTSDSSSGLSPGNFDILALLNTAAEISSEIHLENLIVNIMKTILLNAGAQRGVLLLNRDGTLTIEAESDIGQEKMSLHPSKPVGESGIVPESVIRYVERSRQSVILDNANEDGIFNDDPYIRYHKTRSLICFPMIRQDTLEGIIYLENNAVTKAFAREQQQILQLLGTQAAISLRNAMLYEKTYSTEQLLARQYEEIQSQYEELEAMNEVLMRTHDELQDASFEKEKMGNFLQSIIDSMPSIIISIGDDRTIRLWNREAERVLGMKSKEAVGKSIAGVISFFNEKDGLIDRAITELKVQKSEKVQNLLGSDSTYHDIVVYPISGKGAVIRIDDVTARINIESMIVQTEKMMSVGGLAAGMAHEINNPLGGILMSAQNIVRRVSPNIKGNLEAARELGTDIETIRLYMERRGLLSMIDGIMELGERASKIVENMLAYSRKSDSKKLPVNCNELIEKTLELASKEYDLARKYDFKHIKIIREFPDGVLTVPCIATEMEQVLLNLLKNAAQAMMGDDTRMDNPTIIIRLFRNGDTVQLEVEDNGPGMTADQSRRAFEPFYTTKKAGKGTGLGLSVSYFIITENHGGSLRVVTSPGAGARFIINLPAQSDGRNA